MAEADIAKSDEQFIAEAIGQLRGAEKSENWDNLEAILTSRAYGGLVAAQTEGGFPSISALRQYSPSRRNSTLLNLAMQAEEIETATLAHLEHMGDRHNAIALARNLMRGNISGEFKGHLMELVYHLEHLDPAPKVVDMAPKDAPSIVPDAPHPPINRDPRKKPERAIADAAASLERGVGGDADAGP